MDRLYPIMEKPALRQVNFSLHSNRNDKNYVDDIFDFIDASKKKTKLLIALRLWNHKEGKEGNNKEILEAIRQRYCPGMELEDKPTQVRGIKISENVFLNQSLKFEWPSLKAPVAGNRGFCNGLRDQIAILVDGTVVPCCLDAEGSINLGNIKEQDLRPVYRSDRGTKFYNSFAKKEVVEPLCLRCGYRSRFGRRAEHRQ
jgi:radical SAM protein with 4Fe4S-binding SPASM domain